jgi:cold shock CspA family protein
MARSQNYFNKREKEKIKEKKRLEKQKKRIERKENKKDEPDDMIAYVDEFGRITDVPPEEQKREEIDINEIEISVPKKDKDAAKDGEKTGRVSFFNHEKGFGFIKDDSNRQDVFVHANQVEGEINENDKVSFKVEQGPKGWVAIEVKKI